MMGEQDKGYNSTIPYSSVNWESRYALVRAGVTRACKTCISWFLITTQPNSIAIQSTLCDVVKYVHFNCPSHEHMTAVLIRRYPPQNRLNSSVARSKY